jgi:preprotein translocase subunit SecG
MMVIFWALLVIFILVCVVICFLVLIQSDKGGGISGAIGGGLGGASSLLGTQDTANILTRGTVIFGSAFFVLCIAMSLVMSKQTVTVEKSLLQKRAEKQQGFSPASVLDNRGGLPIKQSGAAQGAPGTGGAMPVAGLPITKAQTQTAPQGNAQTTTLPQGAIPIVPSKQGATK